MKVQSISIKVEFGNDEMRTPSDLSWLLGEIRKELASCSDVSECKTKFRDVNGNTVARIEFE